jgi:hypothetical protein
MYRTSRIDQNLTGLFKKKNLIPDPDFNPDLERLYHVKFFSEGGAIRVHGTPRID